MVVTYSKGEAFEVQQLLKDVVGECEIIGATGGHRYKVLKNALSWSRLLKLVRLKS